MTHAQNKNTVYFMKSWERSRLFWRYACFQMPRKRLVFDCIRLISRSNEVEIRTYHRVYNICCCNLINRLTIVRKMDKLKQCSDKSPMVQKCFCCIELRQGGMALGVLCILYSFYPYIFIIFLTLPGHICWFYGIFMVCNWTNHSQCLYQQ